MLNARRSACLPAVGTYRALVAAKSGVLDFDLADAMSGSAREAAELVRSTAAEAQRLAAVAGVLGGKLE